MRAKGIDLSKYDLTFKPELATEPIDFVIQRASYRTTKDERFDTIYSGVQQIPLRLAYHYLASDTAVQPQIDKFLSVVDGKGFHGYVCDFELTANVMSQSFAKMAWDFCKAVVIATGKRCMVYTNRYHYQDWLTPSQATYNINWNLADFWIAQYPGINNSQEGQPILPPGRNGWSIWQWTSSGNGTAHGTGRPTELDQDVFNGTKEDMYTWLGLNAPQPITPTANFELTLEGDVYKAENVPLVKQP